MNANAWIMVGLGLFIWALLLLFVWALMKMAGRTREQDRAVDDAEQLAAISKPAPLTKHVRGNTAYGEPL